MFGREAYKKAYNLKYYKDNKEKILEYNRSYSKKYYVENKEKLKAYASSRKEERMFSSIRSRARQKGIDFNLDLEDIKNYNICPVFGFELKRGSDAKVSYDSPSVDRINPELGYVKGNVQVISHKANSMKQNATPQELRIFARWILDNFPEDSNGEG